LNLGGREVTAIASNLAGGGVDTTPSTMISLIPAMAYFAEVRKKLLAELDEAIE
jgi:hypothetical protein